MEFMYTICSKYVHIVMLQLAFLFDIFSGGVNPITIADYIHINTAKNKKEKVISDFIEKE